MQTVLERIQNYLGLVRFSHTIFALPFALMSAIVAANRLPSMYELVWILACMVTARTSAMTFNRIVDAKIDAQNPRTQERHIPSGKVSVPEAVLLWLIMSGLFVYSAYRLNWLCFYLSPLALLIICGYSYFKRFTSMAHVVLGLSLGLAPLGAWYAITGVPTALPLLLSASVMFWVAGFDIIYALMDEEFDRKMGLHSIVVCYGQTNAMKIAFGLHLCSVLFAAAFGWATELGWIYYSGVLAFAALISYEHSIVNPGDHKKINMAFFHINAIISVGLFLCATVDVFV